MRTIDPTCKICHSISLEQISEYSTLPRVTSDCLPARDGGLLFVCPHCGAAQSAADDKWLEEVEEIYRGYSAYHQSGGAEQHVFDPVSGRLRPRSEVLVGKLLTTPGAPSSGTVLDVGCATGGTLKAFASKGGWQLFGLELDDRSLPSLQSISGFKTLYTCAVAEVPGPFSVITMVHSLEHFPEPLAALEDLRSKIADGGLLFIEVPDSSSNPFDYVIADHLMHFSSATLRLLLRAAGYAIDCLTTEWVTKEISAVARPVKSSAVKVPVQTSDSSVEQVRGQIRWLSRLIDGAQECAKEGRLGLFGSSIAATWLCSVLGDRVAFFVEEDPNRIGRTHLGRPIVSPDDIPHNSLVYMALAPQIASAIVARLGQRIQCLRLPPS